MVLNFFDIFELQNWKNRPEDFLLHDGAIFRRVQDQSWLDKLLSLITFSSKDDICSFLLGISDMVNQSLGMELIDDSRII